MQNLKDNLFLCSGSTEPQLRKNGLNISNLEAEAGLRFPRLDH
jgi:hypothetical protein